MKRIIRGRFLLFITIGFMLLGLMTYVWFRFRASASNYAPFAMFISRTGTFVQTPRVVEQRFGAAHLDEQGRKTLMVGVKRGRQRCASARAPEI